MALDADAAQRLIAQLASERDAYLANAQKTQDLLQKLLANSAEPAPPIRPVPEARRRAASTNVDVVSLPLRGPGSAFTDTSSSDDNESLFVQTPLASETYDMEGFRKHLQTYPWTEAGQRILRGVQHDQAVLERDCIFPLNRAEAQEDRSHLSHYSIFDVGPDGAPLEIVSATEKNLSRALSIWNRVRSTNADPKKRRTAVGRITIVREPSPLLFAALHYTMNKHIDMDEIFDVLVDDDPALAYPHRAFAEDEKHRRSFIVTMEYFTIIGEGCQPMDWQHSDKERGFNQTHIPISRCSSAIILAFEGPPMSRVKNRDRRVSRRFGAVYDPFSPWRVLSLQAYPDWKSSVDAHDATNHYANGPEAFLVTLRAEYNDARKRLRDVYIRVGDLVEPPPNFIFDANVRDRLLFEDESFTYSRRYFWAYQTLSIMNQDIVEMVESYRETFKDSVWTGSNKIIWPGEASQSSRYTAWRKRMAKLRREIDYEIDKLEEVRVLNENKMKDIKALRDNLFSGTSVMESRRSVEQTAITVAQNRSIMLLTLVTIFFLPLTFVTSVFGMTNMNPNESFNHFAWTTVCVCVPTYLLIGSLNTEAGLSFWQGKTRTFFSRLGYSLARVVMLVGWTPSWAKHYVDGSDDGPDVGDFPIRRSKRMPSLDHGLHVRGTLDSSTGGLPLGLTARRQSHLELERHEQRSPPQSPPMAGVARRPPPAPKGEASIAFGGALEPPRGSSHGRLSAPSSPPLSPVTTVGILNKNPATATASAALSEKVPATSLDAASGQQERRGNQARSVLSTGSSQGEDRPDTHGRGGFLGRVLSSAAASLSQSLRRGPVDDAANADTNTATGLALTESTTSNNSGGGDVGRRRRQRRHNLAADRGSAA